LQSGTQVHSFSEEDCTFSYFEEQLHPCLLCGSAIVFLTSKISSLLFPNLTRKSKTGTEKGGRLPIATHLDQSNHLANQQQVLGFAMPFASFSILCKNDGRINLTINKQKMT
jgi:hypothetical protein